MEESLTHLFEWEHAPLEEITSSGGARWDYSHFLSLSYEHHFGSPASKLLLFCPLLFLGTHYSKQQPAVQKSCPGSDCSWLTGTSTGKRKDRYINTTAAIKKPQHKQWELFQRHIHTSSWVKLSGKSPGWHSEICKFTLKQQSCTRLYATHILKITTWRIYSRVHRQLHCSLRYCGNTFGDWWKLWERNWM